nr:hypothetical protein Iba_chr02aCG0460 [Ipomoea batatas]
MLLKRSPGMELSKNTPFCKKMLIGPLVGHSEVILDLRDHTTVELVLKRLGGAILSTHITRPVFMQGSISVALTEK